MNLTSKAGTNALHASAYEFLRNDKLDANNFFSNRARLAKRPLKQNQFGASIGGPIIRNRTFALFNWESARVRRGTPITLTQPTAHSGIALSTVAFRADMCRANIMNTPEARNSQTISDSVHALVAALTANTSQRSRSLFRIPGMLTMI